MTRMRVQRALARAGIASRRRAEDLIRAGRVRVNGKVAEIGMSADPASDTITVDGRQVGAPPRTVWIALNKPIGTVVTRRDPEGRPTIFTLVPDVPGLTYAGRLDVLTGGLLLLTNDGGAVNRLTHPRYEVERAYQALVHGRPTHDIRKRLSRPVPVDGRPVALAGFTAAEAGTGSTTLTLTLTEGRYRIVRRLCEELGLKVERLTRLSHGPVRLGQLNPGQWRYLTKHELAALDTLSA